MSTTLQAPAPDTTVCSASSGNPYRAGGDGLIRNVPDADLAGLLAHGCTVYGGTPVPLDAGLAESSDSAGGFLVASEVLAAPPVAKAPTPRKAKP